MEQYIEELRAELRNAVDTAERRQIAWELELAESELAAAVAVIFGEGIDVPPV